MNLWREGAGSIRPRMSAGTLYIPRANTSSENFSSKSFPVSQWKWFHREQYFRMDSDGGLTSAVPRTGCRIRLVWQVSYFIYFTHLIVINRIIYVILLLFCTAQLRAWTYILASGIVLNILEGTMRCSINPSSSSLSIPNLLFYFIPDSSLLSHSCKPRYFWSIYGFVQVSFWTTETMHQLSL